MAAATSPGKAKQQLPIDFKFPDEADHYEVLGISDAATAAEIKKAYRFRCLEHHPDKHPERTYCKENFQRVGAAHDALSNEDLRRQYDHQRWSADMGVNVANQQVQRFCMQHLGKRLDYVDMEPWVDQEVLRRFKEVQSSMAKESGFMFLPCPTPASAAGQAGVYVASTSLEEISQVKNLIQRILSEFRGDTATADGVTILLPPDSRRGPGALQQLRQNLQLIQVQTLVRMNMNMPDRVVLWGPLGGSRSQVDAVCRIQMFLQWRGVMLTWDPEADNSKSGSRGKQVSPWEYLVSVEVACPAALNPGKLPVPGTAEPAFEEVPALIRRLLPDEVRQSCSEAKSDVEADLLELLQVTTDWLESMHVNARPVLSRMLDLARSVQDRKKRAEEAREAHKRWEAEKKKRALQEAKARAMGLADEMLMQEAKEGNKDAMRILAEDFLRKEEEEDRKRKEEEARQKAEKELARRMAEEARLQALEQANRRNQEIRERKRKAEELARKRIAEEVERRKAEEEAKQKSQQEAIKAARERLLAQEAAKKRQAQEAEQKRLAEEAAKKRQAQEAEQKRLAEEAEQNVVAEILEQKRQEQEAEQKRQAEEAEKKRKAAADALEVENLQKKRQKLEMLNKQALAEMKKRLMEEADDMIREKKIAETH